MYRTNRLFHQDICQELNDIYVKKNHDYGDSFHNTYSKLGIVSAVTRINDKTERLCSLCEAAAKVDEGIEDTLMDLANYAIMTIMELRLEGMPTEQPEKKTPVIPTPPFDVRKELEHFAEKYRQYDQLLIRPTGLTNKSRD